MELETVMKLKLELKRRLARLKELRLVSAAVSKPDGMPRAKTQASPVERIAEKIFEAQNEIRQLQEELTLTIERLTEEIFSRVKNPVAAQILIARYVRGEPYKLIANHLNYSEAAIFYQHRIGRKEYYGGKR